MNTIVLAQSRQPAAAWLDKVRARLGFGAVAISLVAILAGLVRAGDVQHVALCAMALALLLVMLP